MDFLVGFDVRIPDGAPESEVKERVNRGVRGSV